MSVSSHVCIYVESSEQLDVLKNFTFKFTGKGQENATFLKYAKLNYKCNMLEMDSCFSIGDFEEFIPEICDYLVEKCHDKRFSGDAYWTLEVSGETFEYEYSYDGKGHLECEGDWEEVEYDDECNGDEGEAET